MADNLEPEAAGISVGWWHEAAEKERADAGAYYRDRKPEPVLTTGTDVAGKLYPGPHEGMVQGWLYDYRSKLRVEFRGTRDKRPNKKGYLIAGRVIAP